MSANFGKHSFNSLHPAFPQEWGRMLAPYLSLQLSPGITPFFSISLAGIRETALLLRSTWRAAMIFCLEHGVWPLRFKNNRGFFNDREQSRMLQSHAAIIGCGGLGGHVALLLARMGIGALSLCDKDCFEESNLNRQACCREDRLGMSKVLAAKEDIERVASHISIHTYADAATSENLPRLLKQAHIAIDCLDNIADRRILERAAHEAGIFFVHGAIAGLEGFSLISFRQNDNDLAEGAMARLYGNQELAEKNRAEHRLGVPTPTPEAMAILQALLAARALTGSQPLPDHILWHLDLSIPELEAFHW